MIDGWRYFGYVPAEGETHTDMARRHAEVFLEVIKGQGFAQPNPRPMFPNPPGLLRIEPFFEGLRVYRQAWKAAGHQREPRVSVSRSIFALVDDRDRAYFGREGHGQDQIGYIDANTRAIFGRSYAAAPDLLAKELAKDEAIVAPELGWR